MTLEQAGLIKGEACGDQTQLNEMASVDKNQTMNMLRTCGYLQCKTQWGGTTSEVTVSAYSQLGLLNPSFWIKSVFI